MCFSARDGFFPLFFYQLTTDVMIILLKGEIIIQIKMERGNVAEIFSRYLKNPWPGIMSYIMTVNLNGIKLFYKLKKKRHKE